MHHVWPHIQHALPWLSVESLLVMRHLLTSDRPGTSEAVARQLGLLNRFRLARILKRDGLPPFHRLSGWAKVLHWLDEGERSTVSLCTAALTEGSEPSARYRLVKLVTGVHWTEARTTGAHWALAKFIQEIDAYRLRNTRSSVTTLGNITRSLSRFSACRTAGNRSAAVR